MIFNFKKSDAEIFTSKILKACKHSKSGDPKILKKRLGQFFHQTGVDWHSHLILKEIMDSFGADDPHQPNMIFFPFQNEACSNEEPLDIAKRCYETAIAFLPSHSESYYNLGTLEQRIENNKQAIKYFKKVIQLGPSEGTQEHAHVVANAYWRIAEIFLNRNQKREALKYFEHAVNKLGSFGAEHKKYATLLRQLNKTITSAEQYESLMNYSHRYSPEFINPFSKIRLPKFYLENTMLLNPFYPINVSKNKKDFIFFAGLFLSNDKSLHDKKAFTDIDKLNVISII